MNQTENKPRAMTKKQLADLYGVCIPTLREWWKRAGIEIPENVRVLNPAQVALTFEKCGEP
jgi:hypothetical protein